MNAISLINTPQNKVFQYFLTVLGQMVHSNLVRQIEFLKAENGILRSKINTQVIRMTYQEKIRLIKFGLPLGGSIKRIISIVNYSTFRRWVNDFDDGKLKKNVKFGRPRRTAQDVIDLIIRMAKENLSWGYGRIMGELKKLDINKGRTTIKRIMIANGLDPTPKRYEDSWDAYIKRTFETLWACDFFGKTVWTPLGLKTMFVLFFINIRTREVYNIAGISDKPTPEWVIKQSKEICKLFENDESKKLLIRDGDGKYTPEFDELFSQYNTLVKKIPYKSPNLNPYAEGFVGTIKRECLNKFFIFGKHHFEYLIREFLDYYNSGRPHSGLSNNTIGYVGKIDGEVKCESRLGGVVRHYYRE